MLYFITGPTGVGKTYFSKTIEEKLNIPYFDTGPILRKEYERQNLDEGFSSWITRMEKKYNGLYAIDYIATYIGNRVSSEKDYIIVGNRSLQGILKIVEKSVNCDYKIIYIDASTDCLVNNFNTREKNDISIEMYQKILDGDYAMGLLEIKEFVRDNPEFYYFYKSENEQLDILEEFNNILNSRHKL